MAPPSEKEPSWWDSWFRHDNSNIHKEIHDKLNRHEEWQQQHQQEVRQQVGHLHPMDHTTAHLLEELMGATHPESHVSTSHRQFPQGKHSTFSSYRMQQDSRGVELQVQVNPQQTAQDLQVNVVQEYPCIVQWGSKEEAKSRPTRMRLGDSVDCSKVAAHLSQGLLTVTAPNMDSNQEEGVRSVPVTEDD